MPFALLNTALDMASIIVRQLGSLHPMSPMITGQAGRDDVVGTIHPAFTSGGQMFSRAFQGLGRSYGQAIGQNEAVEIVIPHGPIAIMTAPVLTMGGFES